MNVTKQDILELRRRLNKKDCSFTRMTGCYVGSNQTILHQFSQPFLDLEDDVFHKYLEIAKKVFSGTLGGNLLELKISDSETQQFLNALRQSKLKNDGMLDRLYEQVIANYHYEGNYLILLFHDIYDVPTRARDQAALGESEEIYESFICAICPVTLSKPGLSYLDDHFGARIRDWLVGLPEIGFVYPTFCKRSTDVNSILYYVKTGKDSHPQLMEQVLGCCAQRTAYEEKNLFHAIVAQAVGTDQAHDTLVTIQKNLQELVLTRDEDGLPPIALQSQGIPDLLSDVQTTDTIKEQIIQSYQTTFGDTPPLAQNLLDQKLAEIGVQRQATLALTNKIQSLEQALLPSSQIQVRLPQEKANDIQTKVIDGQKYLMIPIEEGQTAQVNGTPISQ